MAPSQTLLPLLHAIALALGVTAGASCAGDAEPEPECANDSDCGADEECDDGECTDNTPDDDSGDPISAAYCAHLQDCVAAENGEVRQPEDDDACIAANANIKRDIADDPTCADLIAANDADLACLTDASCPEVLDAEGAPADCAEERAAVSAALDQCESF